MKVVSSKLNEAISKVIQESRLKVVAREMKVAFKTTSLREHFGEVEEPRELGKVRHKLIDIITIAICGVICGANNWTSIETFGKAKEEWLRSFLELPNGIPSHDTFNNVFRMLSATSLQECFIKWAQSLREVIGNEVVAIDGKRLKRSYDRKSGKGAIHMVNAWASENQMVLGQVKTEEKSNEITAIPELIKLLDIRACTITIDAAGCQKNIARDIIVGGADYVLALKGNQGTLHQDVKDYFDYVSEKNFEGVEYQYFETLDAGHGRIETRRYWTVNDIKWLDNKEKWAGLASIGMVEATREIGDKVTIERRFFITSIDNNVERFARAVRTHWTVENALHWSLDVTFNEDYSRIRRGYGAENFSVLRCIALNLLKQDTSRKTGIQNKRLYAALDQKYLFNILTS
jgi:predicted transposase YbfD/YdcC